MWQTDTIYLQTSTDVNTQGSIKRTWTKGTTVSCDAQWISKEYVYKEYGFTDATDYLQVFDHNLNTAWVKGDQVEYNGEQWLVRNITPNLTKISKTNHLYVILSKVV